MAIADIFNGQILYNSQISADSFTSFVHDLCFLSNEVFKASDFDFQTFLLTTDKICLNYKLRVAFYRRVVKEICKDVLLSPDIILRFVCGPIYNIGIVLFPGISKSVIKCLLRIVTLAS